METDGAYRIAAIITGNPYQAMAFFTHPDNIEKLKNLLERRQPVDEDFIHTIRPVGIEIIGNSLLEKERKTGRYLVEWDNYEKWWDTTCKPPQWAINFGFIKPEVEPVFYEINTPRVTVFNPKDSARTWAR